MATPKFDRLSIELSRRINDAVSSASTNGDTLSANDRTAYINKALLIFQNNYIKGVKGDLYLYAKLFPEMITQTQITLTSNSDYTIGSGMKNYYGLLSGLTTNDKYIRSVPSSQYHVIKSNYLPTFTPTANYPICVEFGGIIYIFPNSYASTNIKILYITTPISPTDGSFLVQGGSYDSPFNDIWNNEIVSIAEELFKTDIKE